MVSRRLAVVFMLLCRKILLQLLGERLHAFIYASMESHHFSTSIPNDTSIIVEICTLVSSIVSRQQRIFVRCLRSTISAQWTDVAITLLTSIPMELPELLVELQQGLERSSMIWCCDGVSASPEPNGTRVGSRGKSIEAYIMMCDNLFVIVIVGRKWRRSLLWCSIVSMLLQSRERCWNGSKA